MSIMHANAKRVVQHALGNRPKCLLAISHNARHTSKSSSEDVLTEPNDAMHDCLASMEIGLTHGVLLLHEAVHRPLFLEFCRPRILKEHVRNEWNFVGFPDEAIHVRIKHLRNVTPYLAKGIEVVGGFPLCLVCSLAQSERISSRKNSLCILCLHQIDSHI